MFRIDALGRPCTLAHLTDAPVHEAKPRAVPLLTLRVPKKEAAGVSYYEEDDLNRFGDLAAHRPDLFRKFMDWYNACQEDGALSRREKALIGLAVAHTLQCPYCIDAFSQSCLESGSNMDQMTEAIHISAAVRGGAALVHGVQAHNTVNKISM
jgi:alkylhydroperoxidase/carboxymuconolactone decarboxylase family protein